MRNRVTMPRWPAWIMGAAAAACAYPAFTTPAPGSGAAQVEAPPAPPNPQSLIGTRWRLVEADGVAIDRAGGYNPVTLQFAADGLGGHSGCNAYGARYRIEGLAFVTSPVESDAVGCPAPIGPLEATLFGVLGSRFDWGTSSDGSLTIISNGTVFRFVRRQAEGSS